MSMQSEGKDAKGRNFDQVTKDGTGSIGSVGAGGTGDNGYIPGEGPITQEASAGNRQQGRQSGSQQRARTDDLLSDGSDQDRGDGFIREEAGELQTGMAGIGSLSTGNAGSRQSAGDARPEGDVLKEDNQT